LAARNKDEALVVSSGEAFITNGYGERRIGPGDVAFFPAGLAGSSPAMSAASVKPEDAAAR
jgi:uncharacterized cupin superfamily protein